MCSPPCKVPKTPPECSRCPPMCCSPGISFCIFDLESAVFDTCHTYRKALEIVATTYDIDIPEHLLIQTRPMNPAEMAEFICRKCKIPISWEQFLSQLNAEAADLIANPLLVWGVERLVTHLSKCCIGLALVTSSTESMYCSKIRGREKFFENFSIVLCADDPELRAPKPEPDVYLIAMARLEAEPGCTLVFDGTAKGVQAASEARLRVVMLAEPEVPCCWSELATARMQSFFEFNPEEFDIPPYSKTEPPEKKCVLAEILEELTAELLDKLEEEIEEEFEEELIPNGD